MFQLVARVPSNTYEYVMVVACFGTERNSVEEGIVHQEGKDPFPDYIQLSPNSTGDNMTVFWANFYDECRPMAVMWIVEREVQRAHLLRFSSLNR